MDTRGEILKHPELGTWSLSIGFGWDGVDEKKR